MGAPSEVDHGTAPAPGEAPAAPGEAPVSPRALRRDAARNRERLLEAANEVFADKGLYACVAEVADRAGVGMGTLYRCFGEKQGLISALLDQKLDEITEVARRASAMATGWDAVSSLLYGLTELLAGDRSLSELMLSDEEHRRASERLAPYREIAGAIVRRAQAEGSLRADLAPTDISPLLNMTTAAADFTAEVGRQVWPRYLEVLLDGLRARPGAAALSPNALTGEELGTARRSSWRRRAQARVGTERSTAKDDRKGLAK